MALGLQKDTYSDGATVTKNTWGTSMRYMYDRTAGVTINLNNAMKFDFTDRNGVLHTVPYNFGWGVETTYRVAMNAALEFSFNNTRSTVLDTKFENGWSWNFSWHFLY